VIGDDRVACVGAVDWSKLLLEITLLAYRWIPDHGGPGGWTLAKFLRYRFEDLDLTPRDVVL
jgi:hypothetical protein